ncbi:hypothetical protein GCM10007415_33780 [Parapedobacter pyrenivorans]|uniref:Pyridoxamine 5'-phosphate oxidase N-terminal domain-containing protein n=1 Tax=Parapedobacter pyrenivorans TaxID=1305674 RepID=A0A917HYE8_9SPHI|nr:pyridoxamine 5'-phosphate oxidase family protein [Parapedobacter pyrenivorans]GGG95812.1 hypothetical protein GCM10007415_33780 [Parapedobacter pyrenivorans]
MDNRIKDYIGKSVLCWLATVDGDSAPNVSPKEVFALYDEKTLLIANIASPGSVKNIRSNSNVCVSLVDIFVQKGYKLKGTAKVIDKSDATFPDKVKFLTDRFTDAFPINEVIEITVVKAVPIQAPSYLFFPNTTESKQIENAMEAYGVKAR